MRLLAGCALLLLLFAGSAAAQERLVPPMPSRHDEELALLLSSLIRDEPAVYGIAVKHLLTGQRAAVNGDRVFEAASLYKLAVMVELYAQNAEGEVDLDAELPAWTIVGYDAAGAPIYGEPTTYSAREAMIDMITLSDNEAAHFLLFRLGPSRINQRMAALGFPNTTVDWDTATTPNEILAMLEQMATGQLVSREASAEMIDVLLGQRVNDRIPIGLPPNVPVAHKTGNLPGMAHDAGIIYAPSGPFVLVIMTDDLWDTARGYAVIHELTRQVYRYFEHRPAPISRTP
ncbi:MAG: serine hydrolase [Chloroflexota bacterium]|nr:class A beta-lactamase-related serine hydrolase [Dehalococcoidia bacterium]MDW8252266.1 serine hydrolase [Chloroflexota bacterium]